MTFNQEFVDIAKKEFNLDVTTMPLNKLRFALEDLVDENTRVLNLLVGDKLVEQNILISKELNNKIYYSKKLYSEFMNKI